MCCVHSILIMVKTGAISHAENLVSPLIPYKAGKGFNSSLYSLTKNEVCITTDSFLVHQWNTEQIHVSILLKQTVIFT
jgi:hypothetical protein